jgi:hypothetical protein
LDLSQPRRYLSGEKSIPSQAELAEEWDCYASSDRLTRVGASLGALRVVVFRQRSGEEPTSYYEPITLPIRWSRKNPPSSVSESDGLVESRYTSDPQVLDSFFWEAEITTVRDSTGTWLLKPDGELKPYK